MADILASVTRRHHGVMLSTPDETEAKIMKAILGLAMTACVVIVGWYGPIPSAFESAGHEPAGLPACPA